MTSVATFEFVLLMLVAILALHLLAEALRLPPAAALLAGGVALAFAPGVHPIALDPELVLVLFLPPLLMDGAYFTVIADFKRQIWGILSLAVGAVLFTTLAVGVVVHWAMPGLPWAACFALGAIVSPPDAVSAKAILQQVKLPRRLSTLLEGESLLNDAAGLVLFRFAVAASLTGAFDIWTATGTFGVLAVGGVAIGAALGWFWAFALRFLRDDHLMIAASFLLAWAAYLAGEAVHVSGVIAVVAAGLVFGWRQHDVFTASVRVRGAASWKIMVFLLVFVLIGLSLRGVLDRVGLDVIARDMALPILGVVAAVIVSRFLWIFTVGALTRRGKFSAGRATVLSWAGMRGVVTLAVALSLPETMPGRDFMLVTAFVVILVTVLVQGTTLGLLITALKLKDGDDDKRPVLRRSEATAAMAKAQFAAVEKLAHDEGGAVIHPRLLDSYRRRVQASSRFSAEEERYGGDRAAHYEVVLAAIRAGRQELLRLHRSGRLDDEDLHLLEHELDLQELAASSARAR